MYSLPCHLSREGAAKSVFSTKELAQGSTLHLRFARFILLHLPMVRKHHLTQTSLQVRVPQILQLSSSFSFEIMQWSMAAERNGLSSLLLGRAEKVEGNGERARKGPWVEITIKRNKWVLKKRASLVNANLQHSPCSEILQGWNWVSDNPQEHGIKCVIENGVIIS